MGNEFKSKSEAKRVAAQRAGRIESIVPSVPADIPLVFLDIDGVLNSEGSIIAFGTPHVFDPVAVSLLRRLCDESGAKIVVSSAWRPRGRGQLDQLVKNLNGAGAEEVTKLIIGYTDTLIGVRGAEVAKWRRDNKHTGPFVILDDDSDFFPGQPLVQCSQGRGFGICEFVRALEHIDPLSPLIVRSKKFVGMKLEGQRAGWYDLQQFPARAA